MAIGRRFEFAGATCFPRIQRPRELAAMNIRNCRVRKNTLSRSIVRQQPGRHPQVLEQWLDQPRHPCYGLF
jgi:hypothetical protein